MQRIWRLRNIAPQKASRAGVSGPRTGSNHTHQLGVGMTSEVIHPCLRAGQEKTFGQVAAAIDSLEEVSGERIGGPAAEELSELQRLEWRLYRFRPISGEDWQWLARRLARALESRWAREYVEPLLKLAA